jgi:hypothetical protein
VCACVRAPSCNEPILMKLVRMVVLFEHILGPCFQFFSWNDINAELCKILTWEPILVHGRGIFL